MKFFISICLIVPLQIIANTLNPINDIPLIENENFQIYIEIPAGTSEKWEVNKKTGENELEIKRGKPRIIDFIPYLGNYGFFPQTLSGDNDPLDVILIDKSIPRNSTSQVKVLGALMFKDKGEEDYKVIAVPTSFQYNTLSEVIINKPNYIEIIKLWFQSYKKPGKMVFVGYLEKDEAINYIKHSHERWKKNKGTAIKMSN